MRHETAAAAREATFPATILAVLRLAGPILLSSLLMALLNLGQVALLGHAADPRTLYLLSRLQPYTLIFFAVVECLAVTCQVFSARSRARWPRGRVPDATAMLAGAGLCAVAGVAWLVARFGVSAPHWLIGDAAAGAVLPSYLLSLLPLLVFEIVNGALRGQNRTMPGFAWLGVFVVANLLLTYALVLVDGRGIAGLIIANVAGLLALPGIVVALARCTLGAERGAWRPAIARLGGLLGAVGLPVFLSLAISFFSSSILVDIIAGYGATHASGFLVVLRVRMFFVLPAVALATALALLLNQEDDGEAVYRDRRLGHGAAALCLVYLLMTAALFALRAPLFTILVGDPSVRLGCLVVFSALLPTFPLAGIALGLQIVLENLGRGSRVVAWTVLLEAATWGALIFWSTGMTDALHVIVVAACAYLLAFVGEYAALFHRARSDRRSAAGQPASAAT